jgi:hypothetical protein
LAERVRRLLDSRPNPPRGAPLRAYLLVAVPFVALAAGGLPTFLARLHGLLETVVRLLA